jgi:hypothetical protein
MREYIVAALSRILGGEYSATCRLERSHRQRIDGMSF